MFLTSSYLLTFLLTVIIEIFVGYLFLLRDRESIVTIFFINLLTNPLINYLVFLNSKLNLLETNWYIIIILEVCIVLLESRLLVSVLKKESKRMLMLSIIMNSSSFLIGYLIYRLIL